MQLLKKFSCTENRMCEDANFEEKLASALPKSVTNVSYSSQMNEIKKLQKIEIQAYKDVFDMTLQQLQGD